MEAFTERLAVDLGYFIISVHGGLCENTPEKMLRRLLTSNHGRSSPLKSS